MRLSILILLSLTLLNTANSEESTYKRYQNVFNIPDFNSDKTQLITNELDNQKKAPKDNYPVSPIPFDLKRSAAYFHNSLNDRLDAFRQFSIWESFSNIKTFENKQGFDKAFDISPMEIKHIEMPLDHPNLPFVNSYEKWLNNPELGPNLLTADFASYLPSEIKDALIFEKNGQKWIRWPLSPFDTKFKFIIERYLKDLKVPYEIKSFFSATATSSRSMIITDPITGHRFSFKTSTNATINSNGKFQYRPYPVRWAYLNRRLSDYYYSMKPKLKHIDVAWEAAMFGLPPVTNSRGDVVDAAMTVRLMEDVHDNKKHHMSGFVLSDDLEVERLAKLNDMTSDEFRNRAAEILGLGLTEMNVVLGFQLLSEHAQNVRFEMDKNYRFTGKLIILDLSDGAPIKDVFEKNGQHDLLAYWERLVHDSNPIIVSKTLSQTYTRLGRLFPMASIIKGIKYFFTEYLPSYKSEKLWHSKSGNIFYVYSYDSVNELQTKEDKINMCLKIYN